MIESNTVRKLAEVTGISMGVINACKFDKETLTTLFNWASESSKWEKRWAASSGVLIVGLVGICLGHAGELAAVAVASSTLAGGGLVGSFVAGSQSNAYMRRVRREIVEREDERLVTLIRKDTEEKWGPR